MRKIYYIADTQDRVRLPHKFYKLTSARAMCQSLNTKEPGRYQCGDWVEDNKFTTIWS